MSASKEVGKELVGSACRSDGGREKLMIACRVPDISILRSKRSEMSTPLRIRCKSHCQTTSRLAIEKVKRLIIQALALNEIDVTRRFVEAMISNENRGP